ADLLAARQRREKAPLLLVRAGEEDVAGAEAVVGGDGEGHPRVHAGELLHDDRVVERRQARAAVLGGPDDAHQAEGPQLREDLARELLLLVPFPRVRGQLRLGELADRLLEELLLFAPAEIQVALHLLLWTDAADLPRRAAGLPALRG